jgi:peroxiredoxin
MANIQPGDPIIPLTLPGVSGREHSTADYADKEALAVIFSCNHCPYVKAWEDRMVQIQADYSEKGVQFLVISSNDPAKYPEDSFDQMKIRSDEKDFNFPYLYDETQEIASAYGAERTPEVFLFDKGGSLRYHGAIDDNYEDPTAVENHYLRLALDAVLSGDAPGTSSTKPLGCTIKWRQA